ncbi:MAG TPA: tetraacyldisaccharide 4'-kinase [Rhizomicrobium sp.]|jgi:tetraacyldisaccharide 4'-kinase|nr:tetraacyldisaccharide 4'-kinase [Rhizomicrobium sp.]
MRQPDFWTRDDWRSRLMAPLGWLYGASVAWKAARAKPYRPRAAVVCVGNLSIGGAGKTPVAIEIARRLIARGRRVFFLSRGYGGRLRGPILVGEDSRAVDVGDEPLLLAEAAPVVVARDRRLGAALAMENGADTIVMDDGHQNFAIAKDLSLVVVDGQAGFGNRRMIPAGPLREPVSQGLRRANAVVVTGAGAPDLGTFAGPVLRADLVNAGPDVAGKRLVAFAGIGRPAKFFDALKAQGAELVFVRFFADHHPYSPSEIARLKSRARSLEALLVTTEKDFARLGAAEREGILPMPVRAAFEDEAAIERLLDTLPPKG